MDKKPYEPSDPYITYVESSTPKQCKTCKWFRGPNRCDVDERGLTINVDPVNGCCNQWNETQEALTKTAQNLQRLAETVEKQPDEFFDLINPSQKEHLQKPEGFSDDKERYIKNWKELTDEEQKETEHEMKQRYEHIEGKVELEQIKEWRESIDSILFHHFLDPDDWWLPESWELANKKWDDYTPEELNEVIGTFSFRHGGVDVKHLLKGKGVFANRPPNDNHFKLVEYKKTLIDGKGKELKARLAVIQPNGNLLGPHQRLNPDVALKKEVPFGKENRTKKEIKTDTVNRIGEGFNAIGEDKKIRPPKPTQKDRNRMIKARLAAVGISFPSDNEPEEKSFEDVQKEHAEKQKKVINTPKKKPTQSDFSNIISAAREKIREAKTDLDHNHNIEWRQIPKGDNGYRQASLVVDTRQKKFTKYWLLNAKQVNGNGWGVDPETIDSNIMKFVGKPFVITAKSWIPDSEYGDSFEHPYIPTNNLRRIFTHQAKFAVGIIRRIIKDKHDDYYAMIEKFPRFAHMRDPPFCSPGIFQLNRNEPMNKIRTWEPLHLAGLELDPAYGAQVALLKGSCVGTESECHIQFRGAKLDVVTQCPIRNARKRKLKGRIAAIKRNKTTGMVEENTDDGEPDEDRVRELEEERRRERFNRDIDRHVTRGAKLKSRLAELNPNGELKHVKVKEVIDKIKKSKEPNVNDSTFITPEGEEIGAPISHYDTVREFGPIIGVNPRRGASYKDQPVVGDDDIHEFLKKTGLVRVQKFRHTQNGNQTNVHIATPLTSAQRSTIKQLSDSKEAEGKFGYFVGDEYEKSANGEGFRNLMQEHAKQFGQKNAQAEDVDSVFNMTYTKSKPTKVKKKILKAQIEQLNAKGKFSSPYSLSKSVPGNTRYIKKPSNKDYETNARNMKDYSTISKSKIIPNAVFHHEQHHELTGFVPKRERGGTTIIKSRTLKGRLEEIKGNVLLAGSKDVIKSFLNKQPLKSGNHLTDGSTYKLFGHVIATHTPKGLKVTNAGYPTITTHNTLKKIGVNFQWTEQGGTTVNGKPYKDGSSVTIPYSQLKETPPEVIRTKTKVNTNDSEEISRMRSFLRTMKKHKGYVDPTQATEQEQKTVNKITGVKSKITKPVPGTEGHHMLTQEQFPGLRYNPNNIIPLSRERHTELHRLNPDIDKPLRQARIKIMNAKMRFFFAQYQINQPENVKINPAHGKAIAQAYGEMKHEPKSPHVKVAYDALINETKNQYRDLQKGGLKISKIKNGENPYKTSQDMHNDIEKNNHLHYFPTEKGFGMGEDTKGHPMLQETDIKDEEGKPMIANDLFRIVHDINGHHLGGKTGFGPKGEHQAYLNHKKMFSDLAGKALFTETAGQNNYVNFGPNGEHNRTDPKNTVYAPQKAGIMPEHIINGKFHME